MANWKMSVTGLVLRAVGLFCLSQVLYFVHRLYTVRMRIRRYCKQNDLPLMPHSFLFGHLVTVGKLLAQQPPDMHGQALANFVKVAYPEIGKAGMFYFDCWPIMTPFLVVFRPDVMTQFTAADGNLPKAHWLKPCLEPLGTRNLVLMEGPEWKLWRAAFNPGFSAANILNLVPAMVEEALCFSDWLKEQARKGEVVPLEDQTMCLTLDIIGRAVLGTRLYQQRKTNPMIQALYDQVWLIDVQLNPAKHFNPTRRFRMWYNNWVMRKAFMPLIQEAFDNIEKVEGPKTVLTLAVRSYLKLQQLEEKEKQQDRDNTKTTSKPALGKPGQMVPAFADIVIDQLKVFLFAGHDTTANTLGFLYYLLDRNQDKLARVRDELDAVFGSREEDRSAAATGARIVADPSLLNHIPYTTACLRETLRLFPVLASSRQGQPGLSLFEPDSGHRYPTEGLCVLSATQPMMRDERWWDDPHAFIPERFLVQQPDGDNNNNNNNSQLQLPTRAKGAWRPFELGPRNCIGQELAMVEMRLVVALTVRELDVVSAYPPDGPRVFGELAYQVARPDKVAACAKGKMPVRVSFRARE